MCCPPNAFERECSQGKPSGQGVPRGVFSSQGGCRVHHHRPIQKEKGSQGVVGVRPLRPPTRASRAHLRHRGEVAPRREGLGAMAAMGARGAVRGRGTPPPSRFEKQREAEGGLWKAPPSAPPQPFLEGGTRGAPRERSGSPKQKTAAKYYTTQVKPKRKLQETTKGQKECPKTPPLRRATRGCASARKLA